MQNDTARRLTGSAARKHSHVLAPVRAGYLDARAGRPYAPEHDCAAAWWQNNYTIGRLIAIELKHSRGCAAAWPANVAMPKHVDEASRLVAYSLLPRQDQA
jgi:hypothetical protein